MSEERDLPADPFVDDSHPFSAPLDRARLLRWAVTSGQELSAVFEAVGALSDGETRMIVLELALDAWWDRRQGS